MAMVFIQTSRIVLRSYVGIATQIIDFAKETPGRVRARGQQVSATLGGRRYWDNTGVTREFNDRQG